MTPPPVKARALELGIEVHQPVSVTDAQTQALIEGMEADCIVVVAYGKILPKRVLCASKYGCINVHSSLLPKYRGAGPIAASILHGEEETGVTTMYLAEGMDTGDMILQRSTPIGPDEQTPERFDRLAAMGAELLLETLDRIEDGTAPRTPQDDALASHAPMLEKSAAGIDFTADAQTLHNLIRGMAGWPVAHCRCEGKVLKIHRARIAEGHGEPGQVLDAKRLIVACGDGALELLEVQGEGAKRMAGADFLRGHPVKALESALQPEAAQ